jgi:hypothetical protein
MGLALTVSCDRHIDSRDPVRTLPTDVSTPVNLTAQLDDGSVTLLWELSDSSNAARFRVYVAEAEEGAYKLKDSTTEFSLTLDDLPMDRRRYFRVTTVTPAGIESSPSESVTAVPLHMSITINGDNEYTGSLDVQVQINTGLTPSYVMISEQVDLADAEWEDYAFNKPFQLSEGDGVKTVYVRLQYPDGSESGEPLTDDIILDTEAEISALTFYAEGTLRVDDQTTFRLDAGETEGEAWVSFASVRNFALTDDGTDGDLTADDGVYSRTYTVPHGVTALDASVVGAFTDAAGNRAESFTADDPININMPPAAVDLAADTTDSTLVLTWSLSTESDFASYRLYRGTSPQDQPGTDPIAIITNIATTRYETTIPVGSPYFWLFVYDGHSEWARSNAVQRP